MNLKIHLNSLLYPYTNGQNVAEVCGDTVGQCLENLVKQFPAIRNALFYEDGKLLDYVEILVNDEITHPAELAKPVKTGDELRILFMVDGG